MTICRFYLNEFTVSLPLWLNYVHKKTRTAAGFLTLTYNAHRWKNPNHFFRIMQALRLDNPQKCFYLVTFRKSVSA